MARRSGGVPGVASESGSRAGRAALLFGLLLLVGLASGCKKSAPPAVSLLPPPVETIARLHWLGLERLAAETNALTSNPWKCSQRQTWQPLTVKQIGRACA